MDKFGDCEHYWVIAPETDGTEQMCRYCPARRPTPVGVRRGELAEAMAAKSRELKEDMGIGVRVPLIDTITIALPPEVAQYKDDIRRFVDAMVFKLAAKAHKGRWEDMPILKAMELLRGEEAELTEAIERGNLVEVLLEAADVGNFALIVSSIAIERGK